MLLSHQDINGHNSLKKSDSYIPSFKIPIKELILGLFALVILRLNHFLSIILTKI